MESQDVNLSFGEYLRRVRSLKGRSTYEMEQLTKINQSQLSKIERNVSVPRYDTMGHLALGYGCPWWDAEANKRWLLTVGWVLTHRPSFGPHQVVLDDVASVRAALHHAQRITDALAMSGPQDDSWVTLHQIADMPVGLPGLWDNIPATLPFWVWVLHTPMGDPRHADWLAALDRADTFRSIVQTAVPLGMACVTAIEPAYSSATPLPDLPLLTEAERTLVMHFRRIGKNQQAAVAQIVQSLPTVRP